MRLDNPGSPREINARFELANQLLELGESGQAVQELERIRQLAASSAGSALLDDRIHDLLGLAYLRVGEQENCLHNHNADSCLFPLQGGGVHTTPRGAEGTIREFTALLSKNHGDLNARWLLNIAYMALGKYPKAVPPEWLIPAERFAS